MGWDRWLRAIIASVLVAASVEVGVRLIDDDLPEPLRWHSEETQRKADQMNSRVDGVDVVFLGTSMVNAAIIPSEFEAASGPDIEAYNAALSSGLPKLMEAWGLGVAIPRLTPDVVVIGLSSMDLTDAADGGAAFYEAFLESPAGRHAVGSEGALDRVDRWLHDNVAVWAHRRELRRPEVVWDAMRGKIPAEEPVAASIDADGYVSFRNTQRFEDRAPRAGIAGVSKWSIGTENTSALRRLIDGARERGANVVLVQLPVTDEYVAEHPDGTADYEAFERALADIARDEGVPLLDLDAMTDHEYFADEVHVNVDGARRFTRRLAEEMGDAGLVP